MNQAQRIRDYELRTKLAVGGFCDIWLAQHLGAMGQKRWCVVKLLKEEFRHDETSRRALTAEARLLGRMQHPNIITLLEFNDEPHEDLLFCALPYLQGRTLNHLVTLGTKSAYYGPAEALWIAVELLDALGYVHNLTDERGKALTIVHRDVSPENVIITFEGKLQLFDFGIALSELMTRQTQLRRVKGKAQYLSPEQARGDRQLDRRTDIYATGLILYYLFSGREAYSRDFMAALNQARNPQIAPLHQLVELPRDVVTLVSSMLHVDIARRPSDARDLARRFAALLHRYYPGYDRWSFSNQVRAIFKNAQQEELDFVSSLSSRGTQVISLDDMESGDDDDSDELPTGELSEATTPLSVSEVHKQAPLPSPGTDTSRKAERLFEDLETLYKK